MTSSSLLTSEPIYLHDRWEDEVALEQSMLAMGRVRMQDRINKAHQKKDMTRLRPYRSLIKELVEPVAAHLSEWLEKAPRKRGPKPIALPCLQAVPPETSALVTLRTVFRMIGIEKRMVMAMAVEIGTWIEHEARALAWMEADPDGWEDLRRHYARRKANAAHIKRARVAIFNKHIKSEIGYLEWTEEERRRVGLQMIDCVVQGTRRFRVVADKSSAKVSKRRGVTLSWPMVLVADDGLLNWLSSAMDDELVYWPVFSPTLIPPKPWEGPKDGGYWTPYVKSPFLIRFKASHESQRQRAIDEYMSLDMPEVYEALNFVQDTKWKINQPVLDVAQQVWDKDLAIGGLPRQEEETVPKRPIEAEDDKEIWKEWAKDAGEVRKRNALRTSQFMGYRRTLLMAERFRDNNEFHFPHMLDFRGRMYPIPTELSPQGHDLHRGLLTFSESKPCGPEGGQWLAVNVANQFGVDKVSLKERIDWTTSRKDLWNEIAKDPLGHREWCDSDDPWQALSAIFEMDGYIKQGDGFMSSLPVRVDGTCNGIQHLSAMIRDEVGGAAVNLLESDHPQDIYQDVAEILTKKLKGVRGNLFAKMWLDVFGGETPRSITKRPVMILPYGGTQLAYRKYTRMWLNKNDPSKRIIPDDQRSEAISYLVRLMWEAVSAKVARAREVMAWLKGCAAVASKTGLPLYWRTPIGFIVRQFYGQREQKRVRTHIDGQDMYLVNWQMTPNLDVGSQASGIAPNFTHSLDGSALMSCALLCKDNGINSLTTIHDAYGTHASDLWTLYSCIREGFIETHREPVLEQFLEAAKDVAGADLDWPKLPAMGSLDIEAVRYSDYFFS